MTDKLVLRNVRYGKDLRTLEAYVDDDGNLHLDGWDLGPGTSLVSISGEYEWYETIAAEHVPAVIEALGGAPSDHVLTVLARYTGRRSYDLERRLRDSAIPRTRRVW